MEKKRMGMENDAKIERMRRREEEEGWRTCQMQELFFQVNIFFLSHFLLCTHFSLKEVREKGTKKEDKGEKNPSSGHVFYSSG